MIQLISVLASGFRWYHWLVIVGIALIILLAVMLMRINTRIQMRASFYMDEESDTFNAKGLQKAIKKNAGKFKYPALVIIDIKNLSSVYKFHPNHTELMHNVANVILRGLKKHEQLGRVEFSKFVAVLDIQGIEAVKQWCKEKNTKLNEPGYDPYVSTKVDIVFGVRELPDLKDPSLAIQECMGIIDSSNVRDGNIYMYSPEVKNILEKSEAINKHKDDALRNGEFVAYVQPKISLRTGKVVGGEVLCRWLNPDFSVRYFPGEFIPVFERNSFIREIDTEMFRQTALLVRNLVFKGYKDIKLSVNVSKQNFDSQIYMNNIIQILNDTGAPAQNIEIEITESAADISSKYIANICMQFKQHGFGLAMDDFGKEYSSIGLLADTPFDVIKMDSVFFRNGLENEKDYMIAKNIIRLLSKLGLHIVCEGVEDQKTLQTLAAINRDLVIQGYVYSKPIPAAEFESFARNSFDVSNFPEAEEYEDAPTRSKASKDGDSDDLAELREQIELMKKLMGDKKEDEAKSKRKKEIEVLRKELQQLQGGLKSAEAENLDDENFKQIVEEVNPLYDKLAKMYLDIKDGKTVPFEKEKENKKLNVDIETLSQTDTIKDNDDDIKPLYTLDEIKGIIDPYQEKNPEGWPKDAESGLKDKFEGVVKTLLFYHSCNKAELSFTDRIHLISDEQAQIFNVVANEFLRYEGVTEKVDKDFSVFELNGKTIAKVAFTGYKVKVYLCADPKDQRYAKFPHKDVSTEKEFKDTPYYTIIMTQITMKRLRRIMEHYMGEHGISAKTDFKPVDLASKYKNE